MNGTIIIKGKRKMFLLLTLARCSFTYYHQLILIFIRCLGRIKTNYGRFQLLLHLVFMLTVNFQQKCCEVTYFSFNLLLSRFDKDHESMTVTMLTKDFPYLYNFRRLPSYLIYYQLETRAISLHNIQPSLFPPSVISGILNYECML